MTLKPKRGRKKRALSSYPYVFVVFAIILVRFVSLLPPKVIIANQNLGNFWASLLKGDRK